MIIQRLYELAERENLLDDPAFETLSVPFVIQIGDHGQYLGVLDQRDEISIPSKKKGGDPKIRLGKGKDLPVPKAHGNTANRGFARYFCDTLARVLPITDDEKSANSRQTFWQQFGRRPAKRLAPTRDADGRGRLRPAAPCGSGWGHCCSMCGTSRRFVTHA